MPYRILVINPGSTSTKIAVFEDARNIFTETLRHTNEELAPFTNVADQFEFRKSVILDALEKHSVSVNSLSVVVGRGGMLKPIKSGTYEVNEKMLQISEIHREENTQAILEQLLPQIWLNQFLAARHI